MRLAPDAAARHVQIGVLPTGSNNEFVSNHSVYTDRLLVSLPQRCQSLHRKLMKTALAIVKSGRTKQVDVLEIQPSLSPKPRYALVCEPCWIPLSVQSAVGCGVMSGLVLSQSYTHYEFLWLGAAVDTHLDFRSVACFVFAADVQEYGSALARSTGVC